LDVNSKTKILAKPTGITLEDHVTNVMSEAKKIEAIHPFVFSKYQKRIGKSLSVRLEKAIEYHDLGKASDKWQTACRKDYETFIGWQKKNGGTTQDYERDVGDKAGQNLRVAGIRHEIESLKQVFHRQNPLAIEAAIVSHHSKLSVEFEERWQNEGYGDLWKHFRKESSAITDLTFYDALKKQYEIAGPRGLLQSADRRASALEGGDFVPPLKKFEYEFPWKTKTSVQELIQRYWDDKLLLVRAPTGAGKTDASLLWAQLQIKHNRADRLVIAMPTRFTSNALAINVTESLSDTGLYHSSAWFSKYQESIEKKEISRKDSNKFHEFARLLQTPVTVCTIDHLMMALTLTREDHHQITFNLANACLVIDEADFYDDFTQANILVLIEALKEWDVPVLLMSASLPESILTDYQRIGYPAKSIIEDTSDYERNRFAIKAIESYSSVQELKSIFEKCIEAGAAIIYANTVDRAMEFYDYFKNQDIETTVYHSRFTEPDKKKKEEILIEQLGRNAWDRGTARGIAILTQIGEMSINISADVMVSELCPIDRLTQRGGRLCRFDKEKVGDLYVLIPKKEGYIYPAPYGEYNRKEKRWIPVDAFTKTQEVLELKKYNASKLVYMLNQIYPDNQVFSAMAQDNARKLKDSFRCNWLINPMQKATEDDTDTNQWKSRNIGAQDAVFVEKPGSFYFKNYLEFQSWKLNVAIEIPVYLIEKFNKKHILDSIKIMVGDDEKYILVIREEFYSLEKGIRLPDDDIFLEL
jgi:CRISPR-associated endonuclease/helicase Cas3